MIAVCVTLYSRVQEELADGLHLIDFEQLKIENQTYNEKIEERNEVQHALHQTVLCLLACCVHYTLQCGVIHQ